MGSVRSLDPAEDYAQLYLRRAAAQVIENTGFSHCRESALNLISDLTRRFMEKLWFDGKLFAEHAGRLEPNLQDAHMVFQKLQLRTSELSDYMRQVASKPMIHKVPRFPISKSKNRSIYGSVSERELADRPEYIPSYFPAAHPEWCADHVAPFENQITSEAHVNETSNSEKRRNAKLNVYPTKSKVPFPDFTGMTAKGLGLVRQKRTSMASLNRVTSEPSGISSSANLSSAHLNVSPSTSHSNKIRHKKSTSSTKNVLKQSSIITSPVSKPFSIPETTAQDFSIHMQSPEEMTTTISTSIIVSSSVEEPKSAEEKISEDGSESPVIRPSGMFGMPPSAAVCSDNSFASGDKVKKKKKKDKSGIIKIKDKKEKHKEKEKDKEREEEKQKMKLKIHEELASSSAAFMNDDIPLSILSSRVLGESYNATLANSGNYASLLPNDVDEKPCPVLTPILPCNDSPLMNFSKEEILSKPPELIQQGVKSKKELQFKRSKLEKVRTKVKSVEIIPSDESDSDVSIKLLSSTSGHVVPVTSYSSEVDIKQNRKSSSALSPILRVSMGEKSCMEREDVSERINKENHEENARSSASLDFTKQSLSSLSKSCAKNTLNAVETLKVNTSEQEEFTMGLKEEEPPIKVIFSRPVGQDEFSAFSPIEENSRHWEDTPLPESESSTKASSAVNIQTPVTIKLDAREESLRKEKKKKHKKDRDRDCNDKEDGHHHHHHKKKDKKREKEHKKDKHLMKDVDDPLAEDARSARKRKIETDLTKQQPELKIPKLKIKIGGSSSSNSDPTRQPSKICSVPNVVPLSSVSKDLTKVNNKLSSSTSPDRPGQNSVVTEKIHIPIKDTVSEPITKVSNLCSFKDVQSTVKNNRDERDPKRIQCFTKAELKVVSKASKKAELPLFSAKPETRREEVSNFKGKVQRAEERFMEQGKTEIGCRDDRDRRKDNDKEIDKDRDLSRENGRIRDNLAEKEREKEYERKDVGRPKEKDRKDRSDREKCKEENRKEGVKQKRDVSFEKDRRRADDAPVLTDCWSSLHIGEKDNSSNEKWNRVRESKFSRGVVVPGAVKRKRSVATTSSKNISNNDASKNIALKSNKEQRNVVGDDDDVWICPECSVAYVDGGTDMVCCDGCDNWFHWSCVGLLVAPPENTDWFCQSCIKKKSLKRTGISEKVGSAMKKSKKVL